MKQPLAIPVHVIANERDPYERRREEALRYIRERRIQIPAVYPKPDDEPDDTKVVSLFHMRQAG